MSGGSTVLNLLRSWRSNHVEQVATAKQTSSSSKGSASQNSPSGDKALQAKQPNDSPPEPPKTFWDVEIAELKRRQKSEHGKDVFQGIDNRHTPFLTISGSIGTVVVGTYHHPMNASEDPDEVHFVTHMYVVDQTGKCLAMKYLDPGSDERAQMTFTIPASATKLKPYEYNNKQGLWEGPEQIVPQLTPIANRRSVNPSAWKYIIADLLRQHKKDHNTPDVFVGHEKEKHTPYITFLDGRMRVTVGNENQYHVMKDTTDPNTVHYITYIYVLDEEGRCVAMEAPDPTTVDKCVVDFDVPKNARKVTPYSFCNLHGLWVGPSVDNVIVFEPGTPEKPKDPNFRFDQIFSPSPPQGYGPGPAVAQGAAPGIVPSHSPHPQFPALDPGTRPKFLSKWGCLEVVTPSERAFGA